MKKLAFVSASVLSVLFASQAFALSDNTITFQGEVTAETCSVTINGNSAKPLVLLPSVNTSALAASGSTAGQATFDIGVTGCTGSADAATTVSSVFAGNSVSTAGNLSNVATTDAATNVEVQILDTKSQPIDFTSTFTADGDLTLAAGETASSATYTAQYYATGVATAGAVESTMQYAVSYN
ncbi:fimbrial protein [Rahnella victoriana]|uniref:Type 1 fimbrial protein n=1 Tax=Rahnella victoriana TaxID=1510570 RepID=A0ABS0DW13_9GAMM|nr:fimbrial protein [Rahnella victoriana]MBF7956829.1 type 1 fimbrial protein [Rahnella victoriana]PBI80230.1 fimbrial protein [Rahnella victoriana]TBX36684.1 type 1 fimbrial protein [Rahnella victoriana]